MARIVRAEPQKRTVSDVKSKLLRPSTTSHFEVRIGLPSSSLGTRLRNLLSGTKQDNLNLMCSEAILPGSQLATTEVFNDYTGVTEHHAYRRIYDETIELSFYVDAADYLPIKFFETWMSGIVNENQEDALNKDYNYRVKYPDDYVAQGLQVIKFEKDYHSQITGRIYNIRKGSGTSVQYDFVRSFPRSITSMPVSYDGSNLLKCSVQMSYVRYVMNSFGGGGGSFDPFQMAQFNSGGLRGMAANLVDAAVDRLTGSDLAGDIAGGIINRGVRSTARDVFSNVVTSGLDRF